MYKVGHLQIPEETDPQFTKYDEAIDYAIEQSIDDSLYGVWYADGNEDLEAIIYQQECFEK